MPVIDSHTHVWPPKVVKRAVEAVAEAGDLTPYYDGTVEGLLASMDASGIDISVLCPVATKPAQVESINTWTASLASERLVPFGGMHPGYEDPEREIERMAALGLRGMKFHPEFQDFDPADPRMERIYRAATAHGLIVMFHAGEHPGYETVRGVPTTFRRIIESHPDLTVVLAHLGGYKIWDEVAEHLMGERVFLDTAYTFGHLPAEDVAAIIRGHGTDRVLFGSDGPWTDPKAELEYLHALDLPGDDIERITWRNAAELLGIGLHS